MLDHQVQSLGNAGTASLLLSYILIQLHLNLRDIILPQGPHLSSDLTPLIITSLLIFNPCLNTCFVFSWDQSVLMARLFFYFKSSSPPWIFSPQCILFTVLLLSPGCTKGNELHTLHLLFLIQLNGLFSYSGSSWLRYSPCFQKTDAKRVWKCWGLPFREGRCGCKHLPSAAQVGKC